MPRKPLQEDQFGKRAYRRTASFGWPPLGLLAIVNSSWPVHLTVLMVFFIFSALSADAQQIKKLLPTPQLDSQKTIEGGLALLKSQKKGDRLFAWGAMHAGLKIALAQAQSVAAATLDRVETEALADHSRSSTSALVSLYSIDLVRRRAALTYELPNAPTAQEVVRFEAAALAEYADGKLSPVGDLTSFAGKPVNAQIATLELIQLSTAIKDQPATAFLRAVPNGPCETNLIPALILVRTKAARDAIFDSSWNAELLQFLTSCAAKMTDDSTPASLLRSAAEDSSKRLADEIGIESFDAILKAVAVQKTNRPNPVANRAVEIAFRPSIVSGKWKQHVSYPFPQGQDLDESCSAKSDSLVDVRTQFPPGKWPQDFFASTDRCFQDSGGQCGSCFSPDARITNAADTSGVLTTLLGVQHHTYRPAGGSGRAMFNIRAGYRASPDTNWVALRWQGFPDNVSSIRCTSGCYTELAIATEPVTGWQVFMAVPGNATEFYIETESNVADDGPIYMGFYTKLFQEDIEILEVDASAAGQLGTLDLTSLDAVAPANGLIRFVASAQNALTAGGWLANEGDEANSAALAVSRIILLAKIAALPDTAFPAPELDYNTAIYPRVSLNERRAFLKLALVALTQRTFEKYSSPLQLQIALTATVLPTVRAARKQLDDALEALASLANDSKAQLVRNSAKVLGYDPEQDTSASSNDEDSLITSVIGAADAIAGLDNQMTLEQARRCTVLGAMEQKSNSALPRLEMKPEVALACQQ